MWRGACLVCAVDACGVYITDGTAICMWCLHHRWDSYLELLDCNQVFLNLELKLEPDYHICVAPFI